MNGNLLGWKIVEEGDYELCIPPISKGEEELVASVEENFRIITQKEEITRDEAEEIFSREIEKNAQRTGILLDNEQKEYLNIINSSATDLFRMLNDILDYSRLETGKLFIEVEDFNFSESVVDPVMEVIRLKAQKKGLKIIKNVSEDIPRILKGDSVRLRQILNNILNNAVKFTQKGSVTLRVKTEKKTKDSIELHFIIKDTGIGIPRKKQKGFW